MSFFKRWCVVIGRGATIQNSYVKPKLKGDATPSRFFRLIILFIRRDRNVFELFYVSYVCGVHVCRVKTIHNRGINSKPWGVPT